MATNPMLQFEVHSIGPKIQIGNFDISFTNASLFMVASRAEKQSIEKELQECKSESKSRETARKEAVQALNCVKSVSIILSKSVQSWIVSNISQTF